MAAIKMIPKAIETLFFVLIFVFLWQVGRKLVEAAARCHVSLVRWWCSTINYGIRSRNKQTDNTTRWEKKRKKPVLYTEFNHDRS